MKAPLYNMQGEMQSELSLEADIFALEPNHELIKQSYNTYLANNRTNNSKTLKRGEVSGGGKKPWRQKGTGRARSGSIRNPLWRGGGITFGPSGNQNYSKNLPIKMRRLALYHALSSKAENIKCVKQINFSSPSTKQANSLLGVLNVEGRVLIVVDKLSNEVKKSFANIAGVRISLAQNLHIFDVLNADAIIIEQAALSKLPGAKK